MADEEARSAPHPMRGRPSSGLGRGEIRSSSFLMKTWGEIRQGRSASHRKRFSSGIRNVSPLDTEIEKRVQEATLIVWKGFCHVHTDFRADHVRRIREEDPGAKIVVHPECSEEVVAEADAVGSTEYICRYVEEAPSGSSVYIGTEINLVVRLAAEHPDKKIFEVFRSLCPNMFQINPAKLLWILDGIGEVNRVYVDSETKALARVALENMLSFS